MSFNARTVSRELSDVDAVLHLIFAGGPSQDDEELDDLENQIDEIDSTQREERFLAANKRPSIYVKVFEEMLGEVEGFERHLFSDDEQTLITALKELDYQARYLLVRILCRNRGRWLRYKHLEKYVSEIGQDGIRKSMITLSNKLAEIIDLTGGDDAEENPTPIAGPSNLLPAEPPITDSDGKLDFFCADEGTMSLPVILDTLDVQELKGLAKDLKLSAGTSRKRDLVAALLKHSQNQTILSVQPSPMKPIKKTKGKTPKDGLTQTKLSFFSPAKKQTPESQEKRLRQLALKRLGKCISVNPDVFLLIRRLCIIYYRSTHMPRDLMRPSLLSEFKKRTYPKYNYKRSAIFDTRDDVLAFEAALELEDELQAILDADDEAIQAHAAATPKPDEHAPSQRAPTQADDDEDMNIDDEPLEPPTSLELKSLRVKQMLEETILPKWRKCVSDKKESLKQNAGLEIRPGLDRFEPGFVYTRMVSKGTEALGHLKEYQAEVDLLNELLGQRFWRRGKRGHWYERRALVTITYLSKSEGKKRKNNKVLRRALDELREGLDDDDTHIVCRPGLFRRLQKLEKTLKIPEDQRVECEGELKEPVCTEVRAARVVADPFKPTPISQLILKGKENRPLNGTAGNGGRKWGVKSIWYGDRNEEVNVETRALQDYEKVGYRGFHAETRIVTTIFGLLFWDIIFADVPGAFETKFQVAPLDIAEDSFYRGRKDLIDQRLKEIRLGKGPEILERHDRTYRSTNTWCVGVRWDVCPKEDLLEIIECFTGSSLAMICELFCEDYSGRSSGVPDLIVWNYENRECKFVEVKGPGDKPQENQKLWFDALHRANVQVELCRVIDINAKVKRLNAKLKRKAQQMEVLSGDEEEVEEPQRESPARMKLSHDLEEGSGVLALSQGRHFPSGSTLKCGGIALKVEA